MFVPIKFLLPKALKEVGIKKEVDASLVVETASLALANYGAAVRPISFAEGMLTVQVRSPVYATDVKLNALELAAKIKEKTGVPIKGLKFLTKRVKLA